MDKLDTSHPTVRALELLVPEVMVAGGSYAAWLPHPGTVPVENRAAMMGSARQAAVAHCVRSLLRSVGVDENAIVGVGEGGERMWPAGFVGSLTHKGTVVLGVIAPVSSAWMIGIDIERTDGDLAEVESSIAAEGLAPGMDPRTARLLTFSAKEAVFKAQYPATSRFLGFADVQLLWEAGGACMRAAVRCPVQGLNVRAAQVGRWIVSAAISIDHTDT
ncbi:MAG: 4'-phosphopantetheinyl transferase [Planctomycetota bacterium]